MSKGEIMKVRRFTRPMGVDVAGGRKQMTLVFTRKQFNKINKEARRTGASFSEVVRVAVDQTYG